MDLVPYLTVAQIEALLHGITLIAGGVVFGVGLYQYSRAQPGKGTSLSQPKFASSILIR
jgi:hypothetical protein